MKRRAFTLVEILVVVVFLGLITAGLFPYLAYEMRNVNRSFAFTKDAFEIQSQIEHAVVDLNERVDGKDLSTMTEKEWGDWKKLRIKMFSKTEMNIVSKVVVGEAKDIDTGTDYKRNAIIVLPQERFTVPKVPKIKVSLNKDGSNHKRFIGKVDYGKDKNGKNEIENVSFVVYRWYLGNTYSMVDGKIPPQELVMIREYNEAKNGGKDRPFEKSSQFKSEIKKDLGKSESIELSGQTIILEYFYPAAYIDGLVPLVSAGVEDGKNEKKQGDKFLSDSLNMNSDSSNRFSQKDMERFYNHKSLVFSAMVITNDGVLGEEVFSNPVDMNYILEDFMFGQSDVKIDDGKGNYKVIFYFKQINNLVKNKEYTFFFYHKGHGTRYYLKNHPTEPNSYTVVSGHNQGVKLRVDDYGNAAFQVYLPKGFDFGYVFQNERGEDILTGFVK